LLREAGLCQLGILEEEKPFINGFVWAIKERADP